VIINHREVLALNATQYPLAGKLFEFVKEPSTVQIGISADATGVLATVNSGPDTLVDEGPVVIRTINVAPVFPDDFYEDIADGGDRLYIRLRDTSGAQRIVMIQLRIDPL
jgi:hypothetical protein